MIDLDQHADIISTHILMNLAYDDGLEGLTLEQSYELSDLVAARLEKPLGGYAGYKIAWNAPELMAKFKMPHPGFGRVFRSQVHHGAAELKLADYRNFMWEPEIVAVLGSDLEPGETYTAATVAGSVERFSAGFEMLDRRALPAAEATAPQILAHNVFNAGAVVGLGRTEPHSVAVEEITTRVMVGGETVLEDVGIAPQHPLDAIAFLANHYCGRGHTMRAGQIILCGSHMPLQMVDEPVRVNLSMGQLGTAEIELR